MRKCCLFQLSHILPLGVKSAGIGALHSGLVITSRNCAQVDPETRDALNPQDAESLHFSTSDGNPVSGAGIEAVLFPLAS